MIINMRKEFKKFMPVLWVVFISMALSSLAMIVLRQPSLREIKVASVNERPIYLNEYRNKISEVQMQIEMIKNYARAQGLSPELFLAVYGLGNPAEAAFNGLVTAKLLDELQEKFNIHLDSEYFKEQLIKNIPRQLLDRQGRINEKHYRDYLARMGQTITEYEEGKESELKRDVVKEFIKSSGYVPSYAAKEQFDKLNQTKSFSILEIPLGFFLKKVKENKVLEEDLKKFFGESKEKYRIPEKRKVEFWTISPSDYEKRITIDERTVESFYEKNKTSLYRIPPEVKVRKILIKLSSTAGIPESREATSKVKEIYEELQKAPERFGELAKKYSQDDSASKGGLIEFFKRGTHDPEFEKVVFRLKEDGEVSGAVRTKDGIEIVQLVERKSASYKPIGQVSGDIVEVIKRRRSKNNLKSDLESTIFHSRTDKKAIEKFVSDKGFKGEKTDWLEAKDTSGYDKSAVLARKALDKKEADQNYGYFEHKGDFVLFRETDREKSIIPHFDKIRDKVADDYYANKANQSHKSFVKQAKRDFLAGKKTLMALSQELGGKVEKTGQLRTGSRVEGIKNSEGLVRKAFELTDQAQVLKSKIGSSYYLVQLEKIEDFKSPEAEEKLKKALAAERESQKMLNLNAFIASLLRGARIEKDEKTLGNLFTN